MVKELSFPGHQLLLAIQQHSSSSMHSYTEDSDLDHLFSHLFMQQVFFQLLLCAKHVVESGGEIVSVLMELQPDRGKRG